MKNLNNFILNEHQKLFFKTDQNEASNSSGRTGITQNEFLTNATLLNKAIEELKFCEDKTVNGKDLISKCLAELEE
jgi:hypothetical protein